MSALPPVNNAADLPWKRAVVVWIEALQGVFPSHATNVEKKPVIGTPPWVCFSWPERVTKAGCVHETNPAIVAAPVGGSTDPNWVTLGAIVSGAGACIRLNTRLAPKMGEKEDTST